MSVFVYYVSNITMFLFDTRIFDFLWAGADTFYKRYGLK